ncbi:MAG: DNRLRE domain-containing protein [Verrucomicrobiota bacterium JB024]|nr:DNRLRE domain-containing protein [Verrucomicrobiota bacterium JB024]
MNPLKSATVFLTLACAQALCGQSSVIVNEINTVTDQNAERNGYLGGTALDGQQPGQGEDAYFGRVYHNGGDWFEIVVVGDGTAGSTVDMRGYTFAALGPGAMEFTLSDDPYWSAVSAGTIITFIDIQEGVDGEGTGMSTQLNVEDNLSTEGWAWTNIYLNDDQYIASRTATAFAFDNNGSRIQIFDTNENTVYGPAGEGTGGYATTGIDARETTLLMEDPSPLSEWEAGSAWGDNTPNYNSSFGHPNTWGSTDTVQDFSAFIDRGAVVEYVFREGLDGYAGTVDTSLYETYPTVTYGETTAGRTDINDDPSDPDENGLLRFTEIFGTGAGQVAADAIIVSATLQVHFDNGAPDSTVTVHRMLVSWDESSTWNSMDDGVAIDEVDALADPTDSIYAVADNSTQSFDVTADVLAWQADTGSNNGWIFHLGSGSNGYEFRTSEWGTEEERPTLVIVVASGAEQLAAPTDLTAVALSQTSVQLNWTDNAEGETAYRIERKIGSGEYETLVEDLLPDTITYTDTGLAMNTLVTYRVQAVGALSSDYSNEYAVRTLLPAGQHLATFRQGENGYIGTVDATLYESDPQTTYGDVDYVRTDINNDAADPDENGLLRFEALFGGMEGQVPLGSGIVSATLTVYFHNGAPGAGYVTVHRMLADWNENTTWGAMNDGVDADGAEAALDATARAYNVMDNEYRSFDVTQDLVAWLNDPESNRGWAFRMDQTSNGYEFRSSEYVDADSRPVLEIVWSDEPLPAAPADLRAVAVTANTVLLTWVDQGDGETFYHIERADGGEFAVQTDALAANTVRHIQTHLDAGSYTYRVAAGSEAGLSAYSDEVSVEVGSGCARDLVINELLIAPTGDANGDGSVNDGDEFVEIYNTGEASVDLSGFELSDSTAVRHLFAAGTVLEPKTALVVFGGGTPTGSFGGAEVVVASTGTLDLDDEGGMVSLSVSGVLISQYVYGAGEGAGSSIVRAEPGDMSAPMGSHGSGGEPSYSPGAEIGGGSFSGVSDRVRALTFVRAINLWDESSVRSSDATGVVYHAPSRRLFISDSEISEYGNSLEPATGESVFEGFNVFETNLTGTDRLDAHFARRTAGSNTTEPTGITYNPLDGHFYVSDDDAVSIHRYAYSESGKFGAPLATMSTASNGPTDPEGITVDPETGILYVMGGSDDRVGKFYFDEEQNAFIALGSFSVSEYLHDAEGIAFDPVARTLFMVSDYSYAIVEITLEGEFLAKYSLYDLLAETGVAPEIPGGLTFGPSSDDPTQMSIYVADRGVDNGAFPESNSLDGGLIEFRVTRHSDSGSGTENILRVPADYATIQAAINAASEGQTVLVSPGSYTENLNISKNIVLTSLQSYGGGEDSIASTVLDGGDGSYVINVASTVTELTVNGFTIRNSDDGVMCAGVMTFTNNWVTQTQDGIDYEGGGGLVQDCRFYENGDDGIDLDGPTAVRVINCVIADNGNDGVEIRFHPIPGELDGQDFNSFFYGNTISGNVEDGIQFIDYEGTGDDARRSFIVQENIFAGNGGAGLGFMDDEKTSQDFSGGDVAERVYAFNNTFYGNNHGISGGDSVVAVNNIFAASTGRALWRMNDNSVAYNNIFHGNTVDYAESNVVEADNRFTDPLLDTATLLPVSGSPVIEAGVAQYTYLSELVLDLDEGDYDGTAPDIGTSIARQWDSLSLAVPTALAAVAVDAASIRLSWTDHSVGETAYEVERSLGSSGSYSRVATLAANASTWIDSGLAAETTYSYRVRAVAGTESSDYSASTAATTLAVDQSQLSTSFQNGAGGYSGTLSLTIGSGISGGQDATGTAVWVDGDDGGEVTQGLISFSGLFGDGMGQVPAGATIISATLELYCVSPSDDGGLGIYRLLVPFDSASTWSSLGAGISADGSEAVTVADQDREVGGEYRNAVVGWDVTASVQAWASGSAENYGWVFINLTGDGFDFSSERDGDSSHWPRLVVIYRLDDVDDSSSGGSFASSGSSPVNSSTGGSNTGTDAGSTTQSDVSSGEDGSAQEDAEATTAGQLVLRLIKPVGTACRLQVSHDLKNWSEVEDYTLLGTTGNGDGTELVEVSVTLPETSPSFFRFCVE